jgi:hypothetical protein
MTIISKTEEPFTARIIETGSKVLLELVNATDQTLECVEILTVFLKDEEISGGGPSRAHIKFEDIKSIRPKERALLAHRTWIDGKPADSTHDQLQRLQVIAGEAKPYVLDISWQDTAGKTRFQRIAIGH